MAPRILFGAVFASCVLAKAAPLAAQLRVPDTTLAVERRVDLPPALAETSGLAFADGRLYTLNDSRDGRLYEIDTLSGEVLNSRRLTDGDNEDWEALAIRGDTAYVGDFGNNASGNRTDLRVLRFVLGADTSQLPAVDTIGFTYAEQIDLAPVPPNTTDFDAEAFVVTPDSIYVFTKEWTRLGTAVYALANAPGRHEARTSGRLDSLGLVTDAYFRPADSLLVLTGYSPVLQPFVHARQGFGDQGFLNDSGSELHAVVELPLHQVEGIGSLDGRRFFLSNERFERSILRVTQGLSVLELGPLLDASRHAGTSATPAGLSPKRGLRIHPNPTRGRVWVEGAEGAVLVLDSRGSQLRAFETAENGTTELDLGDIGTGAYWLLTDRGAATCVVVE